MFATWNARAMGLDWPSATSIEAAATAGFDAVDLMVRDLVDRQEPISDLRRRMDELGLAGAGFPLPVEWRGDPEPYRAGLDRLPALARAASALGLSHTATWVLPSCDPSTDPDALLAWHVERLAPIVRILADHGIRLGLEALGLGSPEPAVPFIRRLSELRPLLDALAASGDVGLAIDTFHAYAAGESVAQVVRDFGPGAIVVVHVADVAESQKDVASQELTDRHRGLPGDTGRIDLADTLAAVARAEYTGPVMVETFQSPGAKQNGLTPTAIARQVALALRRVWPKGISP